MRILAVAGGALMLVLSSGCFSYHAATPESVAAGSQARVRVTADAASRLGPVVEREQWTVEGTVVRRDQGGIALRISGDLWLAGSVSAPLEHEVNLAASDIRTIEVRRLDAARTGGLVAVAGILTGIWVAKLFRDTGGSGSDSGSGDSDHSRSGFGFSLSLPVTLRLP